MWPNPQETADWSHLLKNSSMKNFIFCAVNVRIIEMFTGLCFVTKWIWLVPNSYVSFIFEEDVGEDLIGDDLSVCLIFTSGLRKN